MTPRVRSDPTRNGSTDDGGVTIEKGAWSTRYPGSTVPLVTSQEFARYAEDGSAFYAVAGWGSREGARSFFEEWDITEERGEMAVLLEGDVGLVPDP